MPRSASEIERLNVLPGEDGYVTATFCEAARYFQPVNGQRIDAIRRAIGPTMPAVRSSRSSSPACSRLPTGSTPRLACRWRI